jgi:hypothetical protein
MTCFSTAGTTALDISAEIREYFRFLLLFVGAKGKQRKVNGVGGAHCFARGNKNARVEEEKRRKEKKKEKRQKWNIREKIRQPVGIRIKLYVVPG